jgi:hypothetical protein
MRRPSGHGKAASGLSPAPSLPPTSRQHQDHVAGGRRRARLRFARARTYIRGMDLEYWTMELKAAELELDAATRLSDVNLAAQRLQRAKAALRRLESETAKPPNRSSRASRSADASSAPARLRLSRSPTAPGARPPGQRAAGEHRPARALPGSGGVSHDYA